MNFQMPSYIFGGENTAIKTPEDLARKRALVDAMMSQQIGSQTPRNLGEGLGAIGKALMVRQARKGLDGDIANVQYGQEALSPIIEAAMANQQAAQEPPVPSQPALQHDMTRAQPIPQPINPNMPPALSGGQQLPVSQAPQMPQGAASGQLAALMAVVNDPRFAFASPIKQKMVMDQIQTIQAQQDPYKQIQLKNAQLQYDQAAHPENVPLTQLQQAQLEASRAKPVTQPTSDIQNYEYGLKNPDFAAAGGKGGVDFKDINTMRKEVQDTPQIKNYMQAAPIYRSMVETAGRDTRASDLNMVYGLGKIFDPTSVVREGEMVMVKNTAALPDWFQQAVSKFNGESGLTPELRARIMDEAKSRMTAYGAEADALKKQYEGIASRHGINMDDIWQGLEKLPDFSPPSAVIKTFNPATGKIE